MDRDQFQNSFNREPHLPLENGSFAFPVEGVAVNGVNPLPYLNASLQLNDHPSSSTTIPHYRSTTSASSNLHQQHISAGSSSSFIPSAYVQPGPCYNHYMIPSDDVRNLNPPGGSGRRSIKRKSPSMPTFSDAGNTNWYHNSGSSSDLTVCADRGLQKPWLTSHQWYLDQNGSVHNYNSNGLISGEGSQRNVRSRHIHTPHVDASSSGTHFSSNLVCHFPQVRPGLDVNGHWGHNLSTNVSYGRTPPGASGFFHNNQSFVNSSTSLSVESNGSHHNNIIPSRHLSAPLPALPGPSQSMSEGHSNSHQRLAGPSHRPVTCYPNLLFTTTLQEVGQSGSGAFSRHARPLSINGGRNVRPRYSYGRYQPYSDASSTHGRWTSEGVLMMDQSTFYDSTNLHDMHRDMRLDIDSMTYEELLALEERIGNVNTGVSEDMMPNCLTKTIYCSPEQTQDLDEGSCVICLETYKDRDELGVLKCGHDYHADCIKKWLLMKNVCPICKACALDDTAK